MPSVWIIFATIHFNQTASESEEDLFLMMAQARLPMPKLNDSITQGMVDDLNSLIPKS